MKRKWSNCWPSSPSLVKSSVMTPWWVMEKTECVGSWPFASFSSHLFKALTGCCQLQCVSFCLWQVLLSFLLSPSLCRMQYDVYQKMCLFVLDRDYRVQVSSFRRGWIKFRRRLWCGHFCAERGVSREGQWGATLALNSLFHFLHCFRNNLVWTCLQLFKNSSEENNEGWVLFLSWIKNSFFRSLYGFLFLDCSLWIFSIVQCCHHLFFTNFQYPADFEVCGTPTDF